MILRDPDVRGVFINIFGGITRGDEVARGIVQARDELGITLPVVVRMTGTNEEEGRRILAEAGIVPGTSAPEAARQIVELVGGATDGHPSRRYPTGCWSRASPAARGASTPSRCRRTGTQVVAGVVPGRGGGATLGVPVFDTVVEAVAKTGADTAFTIVPPAFAADAVMEAAAAGLRLGVCVTEGIPVLDMVRATAFVDGTSMRLIGPNCPGVMTPGPGQDRFHPQPRRASREGRGGGAERHPHLRGDPGPLRIRVWRDDGGGNRGRPGSRLHLRRHPPPLRGRPRDRGGGAGRRDRGVGRGEGRGVDPLVRVRPAGDRLHQRADGSPGKADGPCGGDHRAGPRGPPGARSTPSPPRAPLSPTPSRMWSGWSARG